MTVLLMLLLSIVLVLALLWLLFGHQASKTDLTLAALEFKKLLPVHSRHFPQIRQILQAEDQEFMFRRAPRKAAKRWRRERRQILRSYIRGLGQDFRGLERLARVIAVLSPRAKREQEWQWLWLGVQFRILYGMTLLRFTVRRLPSANLIRLTELVAGLALQLEHLLDQMTEALPQVQTTAAT